MNSKSALPDTVAGVNRCLHLSDDAFPLKVEITKPYPFRKCSREQSIFSAAGCREYVWGFSQQIQGLPDNIAIDVANIDKLVMAASE